MIKIDKPNNTPKRSGTFHLFLGVFMLFSLFPLTYFILNYMPDKFKPSHEFAMTIKIHVLNADLLNDEGDIVNQLIDMNTADYFFKMVDRSDIKFDVMDDGVLTKSDVIFIVDTILDEYHNSEEYLVAREANILEDKILEQKRIVLENDERKEILKAFDKNKKPSEE